MKKFQTWTPLCLPRFNANGFLHAHISYISEDCDAALLLISADSESFFTLSSARTKILEKMSKSNYFEAITEGIKNRGICLKTVGVTDIRHFIYKNKRNTQLLTSEITNNINTIGEYWKSAYSDDDLKTDFLFRGLPKDWGNLLWPTQPNPQVLKTPEAHLWNEPARN